MNWGNTRQDGWSGVAEIGSEELSGLNTRYMKRQVPDVQPKIGVREEDVIDRLTPSR